MARLIATAFPSGWPWHDQDASVPLCSGRGVVRAAGTDPLSTCEALAVAQLDLKDRDARIRIAVPGRLHASDHGRGGWRVEGTGDLG